MKKPIKIKGTINYTLEITSEGYQIEVEPNTADDLACVLIARNIAERFQVDMRHAKGMKLSGKDMKIVTGRLNKMINTTMGLSLMSEQILKFVMSEVNKSEAKKEVVSETKKDK